ncbi:hypothetical protein Taro_021939 [Colocasia esculenta]|uniref:Uncharacterized protein n=1 Tax=Colocasia esculenta TaxID=4460 RepID=A0A843USZ5_COLES|nr:hypothetical protein [Colocasia esculenta]
MPAGKATGAGVEKGAYEGRWLAFITLITFSCRDTLVAHVSCICGGTHFEVDQELEQLGRIYREERSQTGARNMTLTRPVDRHGSAVDRGWFPEPDFILY